MTGEELTIQSLRGHIEALEETIKTLQKEIDKYEAELSNLKNPTGLTTKNDLVVREFEGIEVTYPSDEICTYPKYRGKPYFGIKYKEV